MQLKHGPALAERGGREARGAAGACGGSAEELAGPVQRGRGVGFGPEGEGGHGLEGRRGGSGQFLGLGWFWFSYFSGFPFLSFSNSLKLI